MPNFVLPVIGGLIAALVCVLLVRALRLRPKKTAPHAAERAPVDAACALDRFGQMLRLATVWPRAGEIDEAPFAAFLPLLQKLYPSLFEVLETQRINQYGLLLRWPGTDPEAQPVVLMAHYDVVSADAAQWAHPPFCGEVIGDEIWGRGAMDTKCIIAALLEAAQALQKEGFRPARDLFFSFTNNEETGGDTTPAIVDWLEKNGVRPWFVLDEGGAVVHAPAFGVDQDFAMVGVSEKGVVDLRLTVHGQPGHSSTPRATDAPAQLMQAIRKASAVRYPARLNGATRAMLQQVASYAPFGLRLVFGNLWLFSPLVKAIMKKGGETNAMLRTTAALTMLQGSDAINIIPPAASAGFSVRVAPWDSTRAVLRRISDAVGDTAQVSFDYKFEPSPVSAYDSDAFALLARVIDAAYPQVPAVPYVMTGGTDSKHFTRICPNVYRFAGFRFTDAERAAMHGNDERLQTQSYLDGIGFYYQLLRQIN
ncbi:MAG: M20/M25/M40 family metallo-hydrolase [Clostridia bacterium]|nr:M20/M25/M40 family metallo-hydrolase [Clostridia bacterium]